VGKVGR